MNDPIASLLGEWSVQPGIPAFLFKIALSLALASIVGWERASKRHAAGLRTFILVSLASTVAMILDGYIMKDSSFPVGLISAAALISVAILSTNSTLYSSKNQIKGLTTSVALWAEGVIGLSVGGGFYTLTAIAFIAFFCSLSLFPSLEKFLKDRSNHFEMHLELKNVSYLPNFVTTVRELGITLDDIETNPAYLGTGLSVYTVSVSIHSNELKKYKTHAEIIQALSSLEYIHYIEELT